MRFLTSVRLARNTPACSCALRIACNLASPFESSGGSFSLITDSPIPIYFRTCAFMIYKSSLLRCYNYAAFLKEQFNRINSPVATRTANHFSLLLRFIPERVRISGRSKSLARAASTRGEITLSLYISLTAGIAEQNAHNANTAAAAVIAT